MSQATAFRPAAYRVFRFGDRSLDRDGLVRLRYALDDQIEFEEQIQLPVPESWADVDAELMDRLLRLLHWVAGVSYYKTAIPPTVAFDGPPPPSRTAHLLDALYSEGLGEFAVRNGLPALPRPSFAGGARRLQSTDPRAPSRVLVPVGGGKDSAVAIETVRQSGLPLGVFSIGSAQAIVRSAEAAWVPWLRATRTIDPVVREGRLEGALNGHVPVTAIVSCVALLVAALHGYDAVAMANERSASAGNLEFDGVDVNHQFSKSMRAEQLLSGALLDITSELQIFSILRPASELAIARAFARMPQYHAAFTSCNRIFKLNEAQRLTTWCGACDKCRFVALILAPFLAPEVVSGIIGRDMLDDESQYPGFALLTGTGGHKPFECVGEVEEAVAALRLLHDDPQWRQHRVVARLVEQVLPRFPTDAGDPASVLQLSDNHAIPPALVPAVHAVLGA
jgi:hypothetical protein